MEINSLQNIWDSVDGKTNSTFKLKTQMTTLVASNKVKSLLTEIKWTAYFEIFANMFMLYFLVPFISNHLDQNIFLVAACILYLIGLYSVISRIYTLYLFYSIKMDAPILKMQRIVARLRYLENLDLNLLWIFIPLFVAPFLLVSAKGILGLDLSAFHNAGISLTLGSLLVAAIIILLLKKYPSKAWQEAKAYLKEVEVY